MIELVKLYHPKVYVEIGVAEGYTFKQIVQCTRDIIERAIAVDIKPMPHIPRMGNVEPHQMSSQEFAKIWKDPIDMLFIDGDHNKETVEHDFFEIGKFVRPGTGLILLHDTHPMNEELLQPQFCHNAWEFANSIFDSTSVQFEYGGMVSVKQEDTGIWLDKENYWKDVYIEVLTLPGPWAGMTIVKKRGQHHLCWK
jgi:hypothetical protein